MAGTSRCSFWYHFVYHLSENKYSMYVVFLMMLLLASNQISRYVIVATNVQMANDIKFGDKECRTIERHVPRKEDGCRKNDTLCEIPIHTSKCSWHYTGTGMKYQLLAGPLFNIIFGFSGVPVGIVLEKKRHNRKNVIATCAISWSLMLCEAAFTAFAVSLISSYVPHYFRAIAMSFFMWGAHFGFSMAFVIKMIASSTGWRNAYFVTGLPGILLGLLTYCTIKDPSRDVTQGIGAEQLNNGTIHNEKPSLDMHHSTLNPAPFCNTLFLVLVIGGAIRCGGGHTFYYNIHNFINHYYPSFPVENFLSWIPAVAGLLGSLTGGALADRIATHSQQGYVGRLRVILVSVMFSIPCALLVLSLPPPWSFFVLIPGYFINEMWSGIIVTTIVEQAPPGRQTSAMAIYGFTVNVIGGNLALFLPTLRRIYNWKTAMLVLWPGAYTCSLFLFTLAIVLAKKRTIRKTSYHHHLGQTDEVILLVSNGKR
ncbi:uncharacterized protein LOC144451521 isoform X2 [Glandiceps talaboti]